MPDPISEMHHAAPGARRRMVVHLALATLVGLAILALLQAVQPDVVAWIMSDPESARGRARLVLGILAVLVLAPVAGTGIYMWRLGSRVLREGRFPPEDASLVRDVRVARGEPARARGRALHVTGAALLVLTVLMAVALWRLATL